jgi:hypothetical protein
MMPSAKYIDFQWLVKQVWMVKLIKTSILLLLLMPTHAWAGSFDGTQPIVCQVIDGKQYHAGGNIMDFDPQRVGLPREFRVDFNQKLILPTKDNIVRRKSKIKRSEHIENKLILQGAEDGVAGVEDGVGWSMAIDKVSGKFVVSAAGGNVGYIVFGSCKSYP